MPMTPEQQAQFNAGLEAAAQRKSLTGYAQQKWNNPNAGQGNQRIAGFSSPFGKGGIADDPRGWLTGEVAFKDLTGAMAPNEVNYQGFNTSAGDPRLSGTYMNRLDAMGQAAQGRQGDALARGLLASAAQGGQPSVAETQLGAGLRRIQAQANAAAASDPSVSPALARRLAGQQMTQAALGTNEQAAALRAGEMAQARGQYAQFGQQQQGMNDQMTQYLMTQGFSRDEAEMQAQNQARQAELQARQAQAQQQLEAEKFNAEQRTKSQGGLFSAAGTVLSGYTKSDRNAKTDIQDGDRPTEKFLDALKAHSYRYKDPASDGDGKRLGVMAQDVAGSALGKALVVRDRQGALNIDNGKALSAVLASAANLNKRLRRLEGKNA